MNGTAQTVPSFLLRLLLHHRLQHAQPVPFSIDEGHVGSDARYVHRLAEDFSAGLLHYLDVLVYVLYPDDDRRMRFAHLFRLLIKAAVYRARSLRPAVLSGLGSRHDHVVAHVWAHLVRFPAECFRIELHHALPVLRRQLEMDYWVHLHRITFGFYRKEVFNLFARFIA